MRKLSFIIFLLILAPKANAQQNVDSLLKIWQDETLHDTTRLNAVRLVATSSRYSQPDTSLNYAKKQYEFAKRRNLLFFMASALNTQGVVYNMKADYLLALTYFHQTIEVLEEMIRNNDRVNIANYGLAMALSNCGNIYIAQGNIIEALKHFNQTIAISDKIGQKEAKAGALGNIADIYRGLNDFPNSIIHLQRALNIYRESDSKHNTQGEVSCLIGLGNNYTMLREYQKALDVLQEALTISKQTSNKQGIAASLNYIGFAYHRQENYVKTLDYYIQSLELYKELSAKAGMIRIYLGIGEVYIELRQYKFANLWCKKGFDLSKEIGRRRPREKLCKCLYKANKALGNTSKALAYHEQMVILKDSLKIEETDKQLQQMEFSNERLADSLAQVEKELTMEMAFQAELFEKDKTRNILIGLGLMALLLAGGFWSRNRYVRKTNAELKVAKTRAERSEQFKQQFLANMSHEIRTPMHAISGMVKILKRNEHLPTQDTFLNAMQTSSDNLVVILNDVLDLSKIEAGKLDIESIPMSPNAVIENVIQILRYKAEEKGLVLNYHIDEEVPDLIMGDPTRLNQILINLAGNAIKFTEKGRVDVFLKKENDRLIFSIKDTGIGIPKEKVETIFGAFEQAKDSTSRHYGGTGLGLSISKQLVELKQGKIWAESDPGKGSTFFVELPLVVAAENAIGGNVITEDKLKTMAASLEGIRILLAEDNAFNQMIAQDDLSFFIKNVKIDVVENGALAVEKFKIGDYDLILMDVQMPEMNGFEATRKIREIENAEGREKPIPIIAMTASLLKSEIDNCRQAGMDNYIPKPYKPEELIGAIYEEVKE